MAYIVIIALMYTIAKVVFKIENRFYHIKNNPFWWRAYIASSATIALFILLIIMRLSRIKYSANIFIILLCVHISVASYLWVRYKKGG